MDVKYMEYATYVFSLAIVALEEHLCRNIIITILVPLICNDVAAHLQSLVPNDFIALYAFVHEHHSTNLVPKQQLA
jgi:hypothetical protein